MQIYSCLLLKISISFDFIIPAAAEVDCVGNSNVRNVNELARGLTLAQK